MRKQIKILLVTAILLLSSISFVSVSYAGEVIITSGNTLYVGGSGPGNYSSIQDAVDDAVDGDTVFVYSGIYNETITIDKSINLIGENKDAIIKGPFQYNEININANEVTFECFTLYRQVGLKIISSSSISIVDLSINSSLDIRYSSNVLVKDITYYHLSKINIWNSSSITILNNIWDKSISRIISKYTSDSGIFVSNSNNNIIKNNIVMGCPGSVIHLSNSSNNIIEDNTVLCRTNCLCDHGLGIELVHSCSNKIINNSIIGNFSNGICIAVYSNYNKIRENTIKVLAAGLWIWWSHYNVIIKNDISTSLIGQANGEVFIGRRVTFHPYSPQMFPRIEYILEDLTTPFTNLIIGNSFSRTIR